MILWSIRTLNYPKKKKNSRPEPTLYLVYKTVIRTFGVEGDEAVTQRPFVHRLIKDDVLWENDHGDVLEPTEPLQDLSHGLGLGLLHHATDPHHNLLLRRLSREVKQRGQVVSLRLCAGQCS